MLLNIYFQTLDVTGCSSINSEVGTLEANKLIQLLSRFAEVVNRIKIYIYKLVEHKRMYLVADMKVDYKFKKI